MKQIKGYSYGDSALEKSPITMQDLDLLKKTLLWRKDDDHFPSIAGKGAAGLDGSDAGLLHNGWQTK